MQIPEFIISGVKPLKFGEYVISLKIKPGDHAPEMIEYFREQWREGTPHAGAIEKFQVEEAPTGQPKGKPVKTNPESIWEKIRNFYVKKFGTEEYEKFKENKYVDRYGKFLPGKNVHLTDIFSEEGAGKFYDKICKEFL